jgi:hypothetical protein
MPGVRGLKGLAKMKPPQGKCGFSVSRLLAVALSFSMFPSLALAGGAQGTPPEATVKEAYIYGFPMVDLYRIMFGYFIDAKSPAFVSPFNTLHNTASVYTPADTTVQTPNSDTPYSTIGLDLRAEPLVLTLPAIASNRYYSVQFVDQYTYNIAYVGSRTTGNGGGKFLIAGPNWDGNPPSGTTKVIRFDTQFGIALIRTQLLGPSDLENVKRIQAGYAVEPLSAYSHTTAPPVAPTVDWLPPLSPAEERTSPKFFDLLAFILQFCPTPQSEVALRQSFSEIGILAGKPFDAGSQSSIYAAGMAAGQKEIDATRATLKNANDLFGTAEEMHGNYLNRAVGAQWGILGNTAAEAVYMSYSTASGGEALNGANKYTIHFAKGQLPPTKAFWSLTMYDLPQQLLVANRINRYLINSPMLPSLKLDADGGLTLYIQNSLPGSGHEANWLPAPAGPFMMVLRDYWPEDSVINGQWKQPPVTVVN